MTAVPDVTNLPVVAERTAHYEQSDLGNARRLVDAHGHDLRYAPELGAWLAWDGTRWAEDVTGEAARRAKAVGETILDEARARSDDKAWRHGIKAQSAAGVNNTLTMASTEPAVPVLLKELDADLMAFNVTNGIINLRTGDLEPHRRDALHTKLAPVVYVPSGVAPTWERFLREVFLGDDELIGFVRRYAGYCLTGDVSEQVLAFLHGVGANGKSTFLGTLRKVVGDYGIQLDPAVLTLSAHEQHPTGLTDLRGARFVATIETEAGKRLNEALVKQLTGGDPIRARRMHRDFHEFLPSHKLWFAGNHLPRIDGTDHGIWRRLALVPFAAQFDNGHADKHLPEKLAAEASGILAWMVQGCLEWQQDGLKIPDTVKAATTEFRVTQDHVGRFLTDCTLTIDHGSVTAKSLRSAYETWCGEQGERPWTAQSLGRELTSRGYDSVRLSTAAGQARSWLRLGLLQEEM